MRGCGGRHRTISATLARKCEQEANLIKTNRTWVACRGTRRGTQEALLLVQHSNQHCDTLLMHLVVFLASLHPLPSTTTVAFV